MPDVTTATRSSTVACVDASLLVRLLDGEEPALTAWRDLDESDAELVAPSLLPYEVTNALHRQHAAGIISGSAAANGVRRVLGLPIALHAGLWLHGRAVELAVEHRLPAAYDAHYLALAERFRAPLWTCDRRLHAAVGGSLPWVRLVA